MKIGFDVHGVLDTFEVFQEMINKFIDHPDVEVYIISGLARADADAEIGHLVDLSKVNYFSVTDYLVSKPGVEVTWVDGLPWADDYSWNIAKADFCNDEKIDILFDDSPVYAEYFNHIKTIYCQIHNINRKKYKTR